MILDTSFLLDLKDGDRGAFERGVELHEAGVMQRVAFSTATELWYGAAFTQSIEEQRRVRNLLLMYPFVAGDEETARLAGELLAAADRTEGGESGVETEDAVIAAAAKRFEEPVLTRNVDDFEKLGVAVETY